MLREILSKIFQQRDPFRDAGNKLNRTYVLINGVLVYIKNINKMEVHYMLPSGQERLMQHNEVKTLELFTPSVGVYQIDKDNVVLIEKTPTKQWKCSYTTNIYHLDILLGNLDTWGALSVIAEEKIKPVEMWLDGKSVFYYAEKVGQLNERGTPPTVLSKLFKQEIKEFDMQRRTNDYETA